MIIEHSCHYLLFVVKWAEVTERVEGWQDREKKGRGDRWDELHNK